LLHFINFLIHYRLNCCILNRAINFCPIGDFFKSCPSRAKAGFKKSPSG
jgi:hypothetical protein